MDNRLKHPESGRNTLGCRCCPGNPVFTTSGYFVADYGIFSEEMLVVLRNACCRQEASVQNDIISIQDLYVSARILLSCYAATMGKRHTSEPLAQTIL